MLTGKLTARREIPHEPTEWMEFRLLGWVALEEAQSLKQTNALRALSGGLSEVVRDLQRERERSNGNETPRATDPVDNYDRMTLLTKGIVSWSYDAPVTPTTIGELDEETAKWAASEIVTLQTQSTAEREAGLFRVGNGA
jgi:hypothetical protein